MTFIDQVVGVVTSDASRTALLAVLSAALGWIAAWWRMKDRYRAHVTWHWTEGLGGRRYQQPVMVIQSVHDLPINITRLRVRNGFRWKTGAWPFDSEDPDYPELPMTIAPKETAILWLNEHALSEAAEQSRLLDYLWVPRVYLGVETMGRGERLFVAEGGLDYNARRKRYRR